MDHIAKCNPKNYKEWESYFFEKVTNKEKIKEFAAIFRNVIFSDKELMRFFDYSSLDESEYCKMVECRLMYETWLGYIAERESCKCLIDLLKKDKYEITIKRLSPYEDNKYAVDFFVYCAEGLVCGIQIKPDTYYKSKQPAVKQAITDNEKKNKGFVEKYKTSVEYVYYKKLSANDYRLVNNGVVERIEKLAYDKTYPF